MWQGHTKVFTQSFSRYGFNRYASVDDGTGWFECIGSHWYKGQYRVEFAINGNYGDAAITHDPSEAGLDGGHVMRMFLYKGSNFGPDLFVFPEEYAERVHTRPPFLRDLLVLLEKLAEDAKDK